MKIKTEYYICRRLKLLDYLQKSGFSVVDTIPDAQNPRYKCWRFVKTPELLAKVDEYYSIRPV